MQPDIYARRMRAYQLFFAGGGLVQPPAIDLVRPGELLTPLTLTRTQPSANATAVSTDDVSLDFYAANVPRFQGSARRLLVEGARTNLFLNSATGVTQDVTVTAAAHTLSFYGTGTITLSGVSVAGPLVGTGANQRVTLTFTPTAGTLTLTVTGSCTRVQLEAGAFASSYAETAGASFARGLDVVTCSLSSLGLSGSGAGTYLWRGQVIAAAPSGINQTLARLDDGSTSNAIAFRNTGGGSTVVVVRSTGGAASGSGSAGTLSAGALFSVGMSVDGAGRAAISFNGGAIQAVTGAPTSGLTTFRLGSDTSGNNMFGEMQVMRVLPFAVSDNTLQSLVSALS